MIKLYIANLGKYNEGRLVGAWIELPITDEELQKVLAEQVGINKQYEEYAIHDYECDIEGVEIGEYSNIQHFNIIAKLIDDSSVDSDTIEAFISNNGNLTDLEFANLIYQADEIPFYAYNFVGIENCRHLSNEEQYGYTKAEQSGMYEKLEAIGAENYFDFEAYGRDDELSGYISLFDNGYFDTQEDTPDLDYYTWEELKEIAFE